MDLRNIASGFGRFLVASLPDLAELWESVGQDPRAALRVLKRGLVLARSEVDEALRQKHGK